MVHRMPGLCTIFTDPFIAFGMMRTIGRKKEEANLLTSRLLDRILLVLLARLVRTWQQALLIVQPDTLLRGPRELFRLYWKHKSKVHAHTPKVASETIALRRRDGDQESTLGR
jgi:hypothetical protein